MSAFKNLVLPGGPMGTLDIQASGHFLRQDKFVLVLSNCIPARRSFFRSCRHFCADFTMCDHFSRRTDLLSCHSSKKLFRKKRQIYECLGRIKLPKILLVSCCMQTVVVFYGLRQLDSCTIFSVWIHR